MNFYFPQLVLCEDGDKEAKYKILDKVASEAIRLFGPGTCKGLPLIKAVIKNKDTKTPITNKNIPKVFMIITK
ncbi:MAG: hypothetical protein II340_05625 [Succinivibrio sp.]|nr:hypothetical protein [Succinivibrio sp.]